MDIQTSVRFKVAQDERSTIETLVQRLHPFRIIQIEDLSQDVYEPTAVCSSIELSLQRGAYSPTWSEPMSAQLPADTASALIAQLFRAPL